MAIVKKNTLNKVLADLNLTDKQILEEGLFDKFKSVVNTGANKVAAATASTPISAINLKANTIQVIEQLKTLATQLEQQVVGRQVVSEQDATRVYQQLNTFIINSIKTAKVELAKQKQMPIAQPQAPMQANVPAVGNQVSTAPVGVGMQPSVNGEEGGPNRVSSNLAAPGQSLPNTPEERARLGSLTPAQQRQYELDREQAAKKIPLPLPPNVPSQTNFTVQ